MILKRKFLGSPSLLAIVRIAVNDGGDSGCSRSDTDPGPYTGVWFAVTIQDSIVYEGALRGAAGQPAFIRSN